MNTSNKNSPNQFESSVLNYSHNDVKGDLKLEKRKFLPGLIVRSIIIAICIGLFGYATFMIGSNVVESDAADDLYESIRTENVASALKHSPSLLEPAPMYTFKEMLNSNGDYQNYIGGLTSMEELATRSDRFRNFKRIKDQYSNTYAWVYVDYTKIDYPIMKAADNEYYLDKNYKGDYSKEGSIFADCGLSDTYAQNANGVFYGHCMKNGLMFRTLKTFLESANKNTLAKTMNIEIYTNEGLYIYSVFSGYRDDGSIFIQNDFQDATEYEAWLGTIASMNTLNVRPSYDSSSKICTLVTCSNNSNNKNERYVLHGILKNFIPASQL